MKKGKKRSFFRKILGTGIPIMPVIVLLEWVALTYIKGKPPDELLYIPEPSEWWAMIGLSIIPVLIIWIDNTKNIRRINEQDGREAAKRPPPEQGLLYKKPQGYCFGKYKGMYVCKRVDEPGSILIEGASGSGKSATIIQSTLLNPENKKNCRFFVIDIKEELQYKCLKPSDIYSPRNPGGDSIIISPVDRKAYGFDCFYALSDTSTEGEVYEIMEVVSQSLIPPAHSDNKVWTDSARMLLTSCGTYFYHHEGVHTLPEIITKIKEEDIESIVQKIVRNTVPGSATYTSAIGFSKMAPETLYSVTLTMNNHILQFATSQSLVWALGQNPRKASPPDLLKYNLYVTLPEEKMTQWSNYIVLLINSVLHWLSGLPEHDMEPTRNYIGLFFEELGSLYAGVEGSIELLAPALRLYCRSKGATCVCCLQSISQLNEYIGKELARDMAQNLVYKYYLSCGDPAEAREICTMAGKYMKRRVTSSGSGNQRKDSTSFTDEEILTESELLTLPREDEIVLLSEKSGYNRLEKVYVFKDRYFAPLLQEVKESREAQKK